MKTEKKAAVATPIDRVQDFNDRTRRSPFWSKLIIVSMSMAAVATLIGNFDKIHTTAASWVSPSRTPAAESAAAFIHTMQSNPAISLFHDILDGHVKETHQDILNKILVSSLQLADNFDRVMADIENGDLDIATARRILLPQALQAKNLIDQIKPVYARAGAGTEECLDRLEVVSRFCEACS